MQVLEGRQIAADQLLSSADDTLQSALSSISVPVYQLTLSHDPVPLNTILSLCSLSMLSSARFRCVRAGWIFRRSMSLLLRGLLAVLGRCRTRRWTSGCTLWSSRRPGRGSPLQEVACRRAAAPPGLRCGGFVAVGLGPFHVFAIVVSRVRGGYSIFLFVLLLLFSRFLCTVIVRAVFCRRRWGCGAQVGCLSSYPPGEFWLAARLLG